MGAEILHDFAEATDVLSRFENKELRGILQIFPIDAFYLNLPSVNYTICGGRLYAVEKNPDDTYAVNKYAIAWRD